MLDVEKIKWMMNRCDSRWWEDDSWEIYQKLSQDMDSTMDFLESCTGKEISIMAQNQHSCHQVQSEIMNAVK